MNATPPSLSGETITLLGQLADKLSAHRPNDRMLESTRLAQALVYAERMHGPTEAAFDAEQQLLAATPRIDRDITRGEYAALLRLIANGVTAR